MLISSWSVLIGGGVQSLSHVRLFVTHGLQDARLPCPPLSPTVHSNSCPLSWWHHPTISSSVVPFSCLQPFPASGFFPMSQLFTPSGHSIRTSATATVLPMNVQGGFPLELNVLILQFNSLVSTQDKGKQILQLNLHVYIHVILLQSKPRKNSSVHQLVNGFKKLHCIDTICTTQQ